MVPYMIGTPQTNTILMHDYNTSILSACPKNIVDSLYLSSRSKTTRISSFENEFLQYKIENVTQN